MHRHRHHWYWILNILILIFIGTEQFEKSPTSVIDEVKLSDKEIRYLTERLKKHEHMCDDDIRYTIVELEHFYTILKNKDGMYEPSAMVDKAWHHHILNTKMYNIFSRQHFGVEILHHVPYWSELNQDEEESSDSVEEFDFIDTYHTLVSMYGRDNVNQTVWFITENELDNNDPLLKVMHSELEL